MAPERTRAEKQGASPVLAIDRTKYQTHQPSTHRTRKSRERSSVSADAGGAIGRQFSFRARGFRSVTLHESASSTLATEGVSPEAHQDGEATCTKKRVDVTNERLILKEKGFRSFALHDGADASLATVGAGVHARCADKPSPRSKRPDFSRDELTLRSKGFRSIKWAGTGMAPMLTVAETDSTESGDREGTPSSTASSMTEHEATQLWGSFWKPTGHTDDGHGNNNSRDCRPEAIGRSSFTTEIDSDEGSSMSMSDIRHKAGVALASQSGWGKKKNNSDKKGNGNINDFALNTNAEKNTDGRDNMSGLPRHVRKEQSRDIESLSRVLDESKEKIPGLVLR